MSGGDLAAHGVGNLPRGVVAAIAQLGEEAFADRVDTIRRKDTGSQHADGVGIPAFLVEAGIVVVIEVVPEAS